ncbi:MAG: multifunctional CCA addition/repair protein [Gammaproteobacteria bacterium]
MEVYLVGGAVRDRLLGLPVTERDWVVVGATPAEMLSLGYRQVGKDFPVFLHPETGEEYALARCERKSGHGYHGFDVDTSPSVTLEEDLRRRDLTVNAMAETTAGRIIDPYGGREDLQDRVLRHVSPAFAEDPLRVLRAARFAARFGGLGFRLAGDTLALMTELSTSGELAYLQPERVWQETARALAGPQPETFFRILHVCGALAVLYPEVDALFGVPQPPEWHPEIDTGVHTLMVLEQAAYLSPALTVRFAALTHDLGKGETPESEWPSHRGHERRSVRLLLRLCDRLPVPKACRELGVLVAEYHGHCHRALELRPTTIMRLLEAADAFRRPERFEEFLLACEADARGRTGLEDRPYPQADHLRHALELTRRVSADSLQREGLTGSEIGRALREARIAALRGGLARTAT